ncbi:transcriptional repressor DicA [mine drainage metagenome]|uniref:Transcriptional repressor DicA n=1 Tax=mine drainage metagenome TaxID=410659 RepID=A0A1J5R9D2_9ZZZZ
MTEDKKQTDKDKTDTLAREIGKRILEARTGLGWSQQALHTRSKWHGQDDMGISRAVLSLYETGVNKPGAREICILCETLKVTPNWLLFGSDSPAKTIQASLEFMRGDELSVSVRLALGMLALAPEERDSLASLVLSLLSRKLGDIELSAMMSMANIMSEDILKSLVDVVGVDSKDLPLQELIKKFIAETTTGVFTNYGNLRPVPDDQNDDSIFESPPPPRTLKDA